jgi:hypothetical protein
VFVSNYISRFRELAIRGLGQLSASTLLRLTIGRWPMAGERAAFVEGFAARERPIPPILRGLLAVPSSRALIGKLSDHLLIAARVTEPDFFPPDPPALGGNLFTLWEGPPLGFLHFEKCGGIALTRWLTQQFHPRQINADPHRDLAPHLFARVETLAPYPLVWGHYDLALLTRDDPARRIISLLRDPCDRLESLYFYWRSVDPARIDPDLSFAVAQAHRLSLEEFLDGDDPLMRDLIDNVYTRRLTGLYATGAAVDPLVADPLAALDCARAALDRLDAVGITERMEESVAHFAAQLGLALPRETLRANVTADNHRTAGGFFRPMRRGLRGEAVQAALERRTALDRVLYDRAAARLPQCHAALVEAA